MVGSLVGKLMGAGGAVAEERNSVFHMNGAVSHEMFPRGERGFRRAGGSRGRRRVLIPTCRVIR